MRQGSRCGAGKSLSERRIRIRFSERAVASPLALSRSNSHQGAEKRTRFSSSKRRKLGRRRGRGRKAEKNGWRRKPLSPSFSASTSTDDKLILSLFQLSVQASSFPGRTPQLPPRENSNANARTSVPFQTPAVGRGKRERRGRKKSKRKRGVVFFNSRFLFSSRPSRPHNNSFSLPLPGPAFAAHNHATAAAKGGGGLTLPPNTIQRLFSAERALGSQSLDTPAGGGGAAPMATTAPPLPPPQAKTAAPSPSAAAPWQQQQRRKQQGMSRAARPPLVPPAAHGAAAAATTTNNNLSRFPPSSQQGGAAFAVVSSSAPPPAPPQQAPAVDGFSISYSQSYARAPCGSLPSTLLGGGEGVGDAAAGAAGRAPARAADAAPAAAAALIVISSDEEDDDEGEPSHGARKTEDEVGDRIRQGRQRRRRRDSDAAPPLPCGCSPTARCDCAAEELAAKAAALDEEGEEEEARGESSDDGGDDVMRDGGGGGDEGKREGRERRRRRLQRQRPPTRSLTPELAPREDEEHVEEFAAAAGAAAASSAATGATAAATTATGASDRSPSCSNPASGAAVAVASSRQLFGIFRPVSQIKRLHIVRHGQSTYNEAVEARGSAFADPRHIFDAPLTTLGRRQAGGELRRALSRMNLKVEDTLWIVSPLTRALETFALGCPFWEEGLGIGRGEGKEERAAASAAASPAPRPRTPKLAVAVRREVSERLCTSGDIGLPASKLKSNWPALASLGALESLPEHWWHGGPHANCAEQQKFTLPERTAELESRVAAFRKWLHSRPEKNVVVVGHSVYFRSLQRSCSAAGGVKVGGGGGGANGGIGGGPRRGSGGKGCGGGAGATTLRNCEVATLYF